MAPTRIRKHARAHVYLAEWLEHLGVSNEDLGGRLNVSRTTVWRWQKEQWRLNTPKLVAIADALGLDDHRHLTRPPHRPSIDAILETAPDDIYRAMLEHAKNLTRRVS